MKFLTIKYALEKANKIYEKIIPSKTISGIECGINKAQPKKHEPVFVSTPPRILHLSELQSPDKKVVGGIIKRTPVDRTAAFVVSKAPWYFHPPQQTSNSITKKPNIMSKPSIHDAGYAHKAQDPNRIEIHTKSDDELATELAQGVVKDTSKLFRDTKQLVDEAMDARAALDIMSNTWAESWLDFLNKGNERLREVRMLRMAVDTETRQLMATLKDVRQFFIDKQHDEETQKLEKFVGLCERLVELKKNGSLDAICEIIIKLSL